MSNQDIQDIEEQLPKEQDNLATIQNKSQGFDMDIEKINDQGINQSKDTFITNDDNQNIQKIVTNQSNLEKSPSQSIGSNRNKKDGSNNGDEPNDIDDDLVFTQNTFETGDQVRQGENEQTHSILGQQLQNKEESIHNKFEDSLEKKDNYMFQSYKNKHQEIENEKKRIGQTKNDDNNINIQNEGDKDSIESQVKDNRQKLINDPNLINQLIGSQSNNHQKQIQESNNQKLKQLIHNNDESQSLSQINKNEDKQIKNMNSEQQNNDQKLITFQSENIQELQQYHQENQLQKQTDLIKNNKGVQGNQEEEQQDLHVVNEESKDDISLSIKGSIIPPQTNIHLDPKEQNNEEVNQKKFDYQQLEGFLKNQKKCLVYPNSTNENSIQSTYNQNYQFKQHQTIASVQNPLMNKGNSSRSASLSLNSENFKFTVQPIINSSQFLNQEQKQNIFQSNNDEGQPFSNFNNSPSNKKIKGSGKKIYDSRGDGQQQESYEESEIYKSNFYESNNQLRDFSEQAYINASNCSEPSHLVNKFNNNRNSEFNSQDQFGVEMQKQNEKRFTNLKESINDEQDISENLSSFSKNTVQRYMTEQINSFKDYKKQSSASMLTVESKDMEAATQEQVRKIVTEQVENMIRSKLNSQQGQKQSNMLFNNEELFRQVIREELNNFLRGNTNLQSPYPKTHMLSPQNSQPRQNDGKFQKQNERNLSDQKQSPSYLSQKEKVRDQSSRNIGSPSTTFLNNDEIDDIIDESIQKHQQAQFQNMQKTQNLIIQNQQINKPISNQLLSNQEYGTNKEIRNQNQRQEQIIQQDARRSDGSIQNQIGGDYPISLTGQKPFQENQNINQVFHQKQKIDARSNHTQDLQSQPSYKDQYKIFKSQQLNENENRNQIKNDIQNIAQHQQLPLKLQNLRQNQNQHSQISSENSPYFAREKDSFRLGELSFSLNKQQSFGNNQRNILTNDSQNSNINTPKNLLPSNSKNSLNQNSKEIQSLYNNKNITTFANQQAHQNKYGRENQYILQGSLDQNESSQRDTQPDERPTSIQSSYIKNDQKINYQELITNPPKRNPFQINQYMQQYSSLESEAQDNANLIESSAYSKNKGQQNSDSNINIVNQNSNRNNNLYSQNQKNQNSHKIQNKQQIQQNQQQDNSQSISSLWEKALDFQERGQLNRAYQMLLDIEDDIYLIRMMSKTGPCFSKLNQNIGKKLLRRINKISQSQFMDSLSIQLIQKSYEEDLIQDLNLEDNQIIKEILYDISALQNIGEKAANLYNLIERAEQN